MKELSKSIARRQRDPNFITRYFIGSGIDIGGAPDPLFLYLELFPLITDLKVWDLSDGDAQFMKTQPDESLDFVVSSHCLEHLNDPVEGIKNWFRIIKPGGYLIVTVPEEDLYEQGTWPSTKNLDHKFTFTINKLTSWSPKSINILDLLIALGEKADIRKISVEDSGFRFNMPEYDQTLTPISESAIEFIVRKKKTQEIIGNKSKSISGNQPDAELRRYFNQYKADLKFMKDGNKDKSIFADESNL